MRRVYMDNAATTSLAPEVLEQMMPYLTNIYGNPSSVHSFGREAEAGVDKARQQLAKALNAELDEISSPAAAQRATTPCCWALPSATRAREIT